MESRLQNLVSDVKIRMKLDPVEHSLFELYWEAIGFDRPVWLTGDYCDKILSLELLGLRLDRQRFLHARVGYSIEESFARVWHPNLDYLEHQDLQALVALHKAENELIAHLAERGVLLRDKVLARRVFKYSDALFVVAPYPGIQIGQWTEVLRAELRWVKLTETMGLSTDCAISHLVLNKESLEIGE